MLCIIYVLVNIRFFEWMYCVIKKRKFLLLAGSGVFLIAHLLEEGAYVLEKTLSASCGTSSARCSQPLMFSGIHSKSQQEMSLYHPCFDLYPQ